jgi:hypothetical protein
MQLLDKVPNEKLKTWSLLGCQINYVGEVVTESFVDPDGNKINVYRRYGSTQGHRYYRCQINL